MNNHAPEDRLSGFSLSSRLVIEWTLVGTALTLAFGFAFGVIYALGTGGSELGISVTSLEGAAMTVVTFLALVVGVIVLHELIHAAAIRYYGGDVAYGVGVAGFVLPYAYVTTTRRLPRSQFIVVALAPLVAITLVGLPLMLVLEAPILIAPLAVNAGGAIGDLWMVGILLRYPKDVTVEDAITGLGIYGQADDHPRPPSPRRRLLRQLVLGTALGFGTLFLVALLGVAVLPLTGLEAVSLGVPNSRWVVFAFAQGADDFESTVNPAGLLAISVVLGVGYALLSTARVSPE